MVFDSKAARAAGKRGAQARWAKERERAMTLEKVAAELGPLGTEDDAIRWRHKLGLWMACGLVPHGYSGAIAQLLNGFSRDLELKHDRQDFVRLQAEHDRLTRRVKELERENAKLRGEKVRVA